MTFPLPHRYTRRLHVRDVAGLVHRAYEFRADPILRHRWLCTLDVYVKTKDPEPHVDALVTCLGCLASLVWLDNVLDSAEGWRP